MPGPVSRRRISICLAVSGLLATAACPKDDADDSACRAGPGVDDEDKVVKCVEHNRCIGLQPHPACPASPDGAAALCSLHGGGYPVTRGACGQDTVVLWSGGTSGVFCLYDAAGTLKGTLSRTDSPSYCRRFGHWTWGADISDACQRSKHANICLADGGVPDATGGADVVDARINVDCALVGCPGAAGGTAIGGGPRVVDGAGVTGPPDAIDMQLDLPMRSSVLLGGRSPSVRSAK